MEAVPLHYGKEFIKTILHTKEKNKHMKITSEKWYWVLGDTQKGFKIVDKKPRTKFVPEPFNSLENAKRWIAMEFLLNA